MKRISLMMAFIGMILFLSISYASENHWEFAGWYGGGCYPNLAFDPHNKDRVYLTSDVAGIWRSDDLGEHWHFITKGLGQMTVAQVAVAPSDSHVLYAATGGGLFVSKNAGDSWTAANDEQGKITFKRPENYRPIAIDGKNSNKLCIGTVKAQLFCSDDFGTHWKNIDPDGKSFSGSTNITALSFDKQGKLYVSSDKGLSVCSTEGGCQSIPGAPASITDFVFSQKSPSIFLAAGDDKLWISNDSGATWKSSNSIPQGKTYRIALDESGSTPVIRVIWGKDWKGGELVSRDQGQTWEAQDSNLNADIASDPTDLWASKGGRSTGVQVDPFDPNVVFRTDWWGVWRSDDGGASWNEKIIGAPDSVATHIVIDPSGDIYVAAMDNGLLRSHDGGKTYEMLFPRKYDPSESGHIWRVAVSGNTIVGTSSPWNDVVNQVIYSENSGSTFALVRDGFPAGRPQGNTMWGEGYPRALAVDPNNPNNIYLGMDGDDGGGLFVSKDKGLSWQRSQGQPGSLRVYNGLAVDPTDSNRIIWGASSNGGGVYVSEDAGKTFKLREKQMDWVFGVAISSDGNMYAAGDSSGAKLFASVDHGQSWNMIGDFGKDRALAAVTIDPNDSKRIAVSTVSWNNKPCKIFLSIDSGKNWQDITADLPDGAGASSIAFDPKGKYLYIARYAGSVYRLAL